MNILNIFKIFTIIFLITLNLNAESIKIIVKVQDQIITNVDIDNERKYLLFLNPKLEELNNSKINQITKESLITEVIKKKELEKYFDLKKKTNFIETVEKRFFKNNKIKDKSEFINILNSKNLNYDTIKKKLLIEALWNELIYKKYANNIKVDKKSLRQKILNQFKNKEKKYEYNLSEIFFTETANENIGETINKLNNSINKIGFENTANIFSISSTAKNGGLIGWINELQISEKIKENILKLNKKEVSRPIKIGEGYLLVKLNDKREFKQEIDIEEQVKQLANKETNRQLNTYSIIFYKRLKKNIQIDEL